LSFSQTIVQVKIEIDSLPHWWYVVNVLKVERVAHNYLEVGHTQNENDSVHSTIESRSRRARIDTPEQWSGVIATARQNKPYVVTDMQIVDFYDFKKMSGSLRNLDVCEDNSRVKWTKIRRMKFSAKKQTS